MMMYCGKQACKSNIAVVNLARNHSLNELSGHIFFVRDQETDFWCLGLEKFVPRKSCFWSPDRMLMLWQKDSSTLKETTPLRTAVDRGVGNDLELDCPVLLVNVSLSERLYLYVCHTSWCGVFLFVLIISSSSWWVHWHSRKSLQQQLRYCWLSGVFIWKKSVSHSVSQCLLILSVDVLSVMLLLSF